MYTASFSVDFSITALTTFLPSMETGVAVNGSVEVVTVVVSSVVLHSSDGRDAVTL